MSNGSLKACYRKARYTRREATLALKARKREKPWQFLRTYLCPHCHYWHTTSKRKVR